ncbi:MAG: biopolymer transporter ExbD [Firmicutes bacterium]|nr:biopolymer transporter ExbD [Bacillota bacterium]
MEFTRSRRKLPRPDLLPLVDVVFYMLIFYIVFSSLQHSGMSLEVELPKAVSGSTQTAQFEVAVHRNGAFYVDGKNVTGTELRALVQAKLVSEPDLFIIVKGDKQASYEHIVSALDHIKAVGGHNLGLAVEVGN